MKLWMLRWLPQGRMLPESAWRSRHRVVLTLALGQALALGLWSALAGPDPALAPWHGLLVALPAMVAAVPTLGRQLRSSLATLSLMAASMMLIYLWGGQTEAHFHFFVMIAVVALYQDWAPFGTALVAVLAHHGILGTVLPHDVFGHHGAHMHPWLWAGIHAAFVLAASVAALAAWRLNEQILLRDAVTGLASRTLFGELVTNAARREEAFGVVFIDLDDFKGVNDTHGHHVGDRLLETVAGRLSTALPRHDTLARLGGDEFAALVHGSPGAVELVAHRLKASLSEPVDLDELSVRVGASIGVSTSMPSNGSRRPAPAVVLSAMQRDADIAMYAAKRRGKDQVAVFTPGLDEASQRQSDLQRDLRVAVARGQVEVHYQPVVEVRGAAVVGYEALARWDHPIVGTVNPADFIAWAERDGTIVDLGIHVLGRAIARAAALSRQHRHPVHMSVNVSPVQLAHPGFDRTVQDMLDAHELPACQLMLEITENAVTSDPGRAIEVLHRLRRLGVRIAVDDFGTGLANLSYLRTMPVDVLKIDRSFVAGISHDTISRTLVSSMVQLAGSLGLDVVAEGVETLEQRRVLEEMDCLTAQGFLYAHPAAEPVLVVDQPDLEKGPAYGSAEPTPSTELTPKTPPTHSPTTLPASTSTSMDRRHVSGRGWVDRSHALDGFLELAGVGPRARCRCGFITVPADDHDSAVVKLETDHGLDEASCTYCAHPAPRLAGVTRSVLDLTVLHYQAAAGALVCAHGPCAVRHREAAHHATTPATGRPA